MSKPDVTCYEFGPFRLLPNERLLLRGGVSVPLTPKVFDTLLTFVQNSGRLLSKDDLMSMIWPDTTVEEGNLTQNIFILRKVFGESPHDHQYLVTIPLRGYRFVARVREVNEASGERATDPGATLRPGLGGAHREIDSIAVLPFRLLSNESGDDYLGVGITDALITKLSSLRQIAVRPTTAILKYAEASQDPVAAGREQGVEAVVAGTIQRSGDRIRVNVQLVRVPAGETLWADKFDEHFTDIFAVQDSISRQVVAALEVELSGEERKQLSESYTDNLEAYKLYIKGRYFWDKRTEGGLRKGIECAQQVSMLDPGFALAHVGVADSYALMGEYLYLDPQEAFPKTKAAALKALALDPTLAEAHASLAEVAFFYDWDWPEAERQYRLAIEMNRHYAGAYHWYAWFLMTQGRFDEATKRIKQALKLDPGSLILNTVLGLLPYYQRRYAEAIEQFRQTLEMDAGFTQAHYYLGSALAQTGEYAGAIAALKRVKAREYTQQSSALLAYAYAVSGKRERALVLLDELIALSKQRYVSPYVLAVVYAGLDEKEQAFAQLEKAYRARAAWLVFLRVDPFFDRLRSDQRFAELLRRLRHQTAA